MTQRDPDSHPENTAEEVEDASDVRIPEILDPEESPASETGISANPTAAGPASTAVEPVSALTRYMAQLRHHAPISREEERELALRWYNEGDAEAARRMVLSNLRLVVKIAMEDRRAWTQTLDLIQEGNVGLMEAVQRFDPYQDVKLSSYAVYWIRAYILKYILDNMRSTRIGTTRAERKLFFRLNKEKRQLESEGFEVEPKLLAERLDVTEEDVVQMEARLAQPDLSLDAPTLRGEGRATHGDLMPSPGSSAEDQLGNSELRELFLERVAEFSETLNERETQILHERVLSEDPRTLAEIGEELGVSRERVRQLEARLVKRLGEYVKERMVDFDYYVTPNE